LATNLEVQIFSNLILSKLIDVLSRLAAHWLPHSAGNSLWVTFAAGGQTSGKKEKRNKKPNEQQSLGATKQSGPFQGALSSARFIDQHCSLFLFLFLLLCSTSLEKNTSSSKIIAEHAQKQSKLKLK